MDDQWLVPHFEKMLYDNALLALAYAHAFSLTREPRYQQIAEKTLDFMQQELAHHEGGFYASLDADTPDGEGRYYAYTYQELEKFLSGEQFRFLNRITTIRKQGNFENELNILQLSGDPAVLSQDLGIHPKELQSKLSDIFSLLNSKRAERTKPRRDKKVIAAWNALAVRAFAESGLILDREDYQETAIRSISFLLEELRSADGHLFRSWSQGKTSYPGTLQDYAGMILALNAVYQINFSSEYYLLMGELYRIMTAEFSSDGNLYYDTAASINNLIVRPQSLQDNVVPSGNSLTAHAHWLFSNYEHKQEVEETIGNMLAIIHTQAQKYPTSFGYWLQVADKNSQSGTQVALISKSDINSVKPFLDIYRKEFRPYAVVGVKLGDHIQEHALPGILLDRPSINGEPTAYVCHNFICMRPTVDPEIFQEQVEDN